LDELMKIKDAASYLRLNSMTVYRLAQKGMLPAFKVGGNWRFRKDILDDWVRQKATMNTISTLVVDDDPMIREVLSEIIRDQNCSVTAVESGELALEEVTNKHFDLIFLDLMLPGLNGLEVLKAIKEIDKSAVVVIVTGFADDEIAIKAVNYGPLTLLRKPFKDSDILEVLDMIMTRKRV
jgi:excisionase family DNA binding protein